VSPQCLDRAYSLEPQLLKAMPANSNSARSDKVNLRWQRKSVAAELLLLVLLLLFFYFYFYYYYYYYFFFLLFFFLLLFFFPFFKMS